MSYFGRKGKYSIATVRNMHMICISYLNTYVHDISCKGGDSYQKCGAHNSQDCSIRVYVNMLVI